ncbi:sigma-70 family RNA polymerase sigma factor [Ornithinimicrobium pekingense]|uniref:sigma-70 family RNA polymerase sigma factor n=1 Tax=Ornithinimicrobium pekingense TaxID=384677 RepID=UPI001E51BD30|nr:sigma-70 family RNA polymerase sigma factor [Ornithinimicrobium pekingense]
MGLWGTSAVGIVSGHAVTLGPPAPAASRLVARPAVVRGPARTAPRQAAAGAGATLPDDLRGLARAARGGDAQARERLLGGVLTIAHRYARARLGTYPAAAEVAADVAQEVGMGVLTALPTYDDRGAPFEAFVYRIASRKVADAQRAHARGPVPTDHVGSPLFDAHVVSAETHVVERDEAARAWALLETLSERHREVLVLRVGVGLSAAEAADALGMTPGAVRVTQHRALTELRERWAELAR